MVEELLKLFTADNVVFVLITFIGMFAHAYKKHLKGQLKGSLKDYFFHNPNHTGLAAMAVLGASLAIILGEQIPTQVGSYILLAFTTGYTADSSINKDME